MKLTATCVFVALFAWDTRHTWSFYEPMHGWPMPWNNLWYIEQHVWSPRLLMFDVSLWCVLTAATVYVAGVIARLIAHRQFPLSGIFSLFVVVAVLLSLWRAEEWLQINPGNDSISPRYGRVAIAGRDLWFDLGLFSDPPDAWLAARISIVLSIGCVVFCALRLTLALVNSLRKQVYRALKSS